MSKPKPKTLDEWVISIEKFKDNVDPNEENLYWNKKSIYHVPNFIKKNLPGKPFAPYVVSWGPFYNGAEHLKPLEVHKHRALTHFLKRSEKPVSDFVKKMESVLDELMDSYEDLDTKWTENRDDFLKMMLLDGCFMLEVLRTKGDDKTNNNNININININNNINNNNDKKVKYRDIYATNDPVFSLEAARTRMPFLKRDMLLLENQLPLLVLKTLLEAEKSAPHVDDSEINDLVVRFFGENLRVKKTTLARHPLELYRDSLLHTEKQSNRPISRSLKEPYSFGHRKKERRGVNWSVVDLRDAGVLFKKSDNKHLMKAIEFDWNGRLTLPVLEVHDGTESNLLNLVAFEQIHIGIGSEITSYVAFMGELIDTPEDVRLLQERGIIKNSSGSNQDIADMFNRIAKDSTLDPKCELGEVRQQVNEYCGRTWNRWRTNMKHTYFKSPWSLISLIGAIFVILLTVVQTVFGILQVVHP